MTLQELDSLALSHDLVNDLRHEADETKTLDTKEQIVASVLHTGDEKESTKAAQRVIFTEHVVEALRDKVTHHTTAALYQRALALPCSKAKTLFWGQGG